MENDRIKVYDKLMDLPADPNQISKRDFVTAHLFVARSIVHFSFHEAYLLLRDAQERLVRVYNDRRDPIFLEEMANCYYVVKNYRQAIEEYNNLLDQNIAPETKMLFNIALCYYRLGMNKEAINNYKHSIMADSTNVWSMNNLAMLYHEMGDKELALETLENLLDNVPDDVEALNNIGLIYFQQGRYEDAIVKFLKSLEQREDIETYNNLGCALSEKELYDDACVAFCQALELNPKNKQALYNMTCVLLESFQYEEAKAMIKQCSKLLSNEQTKELKNELENLKKIREKPGAAFEKQVDFAKKIRKRLAKKVQLIEALGPEYLAVVDSEDEEQQGAKFIGSFTAAKKMFESQKSANFLKQISKLQVKKMFG